MQKIILMAAAMTMAIAIPTDGNALVEHLKDDEAIAARCVNEWGDDFQMQNYCRERHLDARANIIHYCQANGLCKPFDAIAAQSQTGDTSASILRRCIDDWSDRYGLEWTMVNYCRERQEEALRRLQ